MWIVSLDGKREIQSQSGWIPIHLSEQHSTVTLVHVSCDEVNMLIEIHMIMQAIASQYQKMKFS